MWSCGKWTPGVAEIDAGYTGLLLASASPRRRELLKQVGYKFEVAAADIDETRRAGESPEIFVERVARWKGAALLQRFPAATMLSADTTVVLDGDVLNKPVDLAEAKRMLRALAGRTHQVMTAVHVARHHFSRGHVETTQVTFGAIDEASLQAYLATGDSLDKAGAYGIQGYAARWIPHIEGDYFNVVGLPLAATVALLREAHVGL